ncbi:hypothetical protein O181_008653 [Austropuccinia psidii MF-1]|uniref:Reverse transcriptase domain-containing protein n=1 Tax=Austropuccinia psidii MF-1 TaxID=1389203 RepID=A0A9Q3GIP9_9BASI|nr:hypothetical protein [Austropuccinia psidii MF-1]
MPIQHSPPARQTRSQARTPASTLLEGEAPSRKEGRVPRRSSPFSGVVGRVPGTSKTVFIGPLEAGEEEDENSVEEEESDGTEGISAPVGASQGTEGPTLTQSNHPVSHQSEPSLFAIMQQMTQIMANLQAALSSEASRPPAFKTPSMKSPECFDGTQPFKPYLSNLPNQDPNYLLNSWRLFVSQFFNLFGDQNEVRKAEAELESLRMKEGGNVSLYMADFRSLVSMIGDWGERALIHHFRKELPCRILDQLASHPSRIDSLQDLMDITLELDTRYHERKNEKSNHQEKKPEASKSHSSHPQSSSSSIFKDIQDVGEDNSVSSLHLSFGNMDLPSSSYHDSLQELWDEEEEPEGIETVMKVVPPVFHKYLDVFSKVKAERLPPQRACDHHIKLKGSLPPVGVIYSLSNQESDTLKAYVSENVEKVFIWPSSSSTGEPVLFVKKEDFGLHLCVYYHKLNAVTRKNKYPVPPMNQLLGVFNGSSIFSKIVLHGAYNLLRIKEGDEHLKCFRTKYGSYEYLVMPFGLTNAPASFQNLVNDIFHVLLDIYVVVYLYDIMVFSKSEEEHVTHVSTVLSRLRANNLCAKASKCLFHVSSPPPRNLKALQSFLGFANFYRCFINNYSKKICSLTSFLKNDSRFLLNEEALRQFHQLKETFTISPILSHLDPSLLTILETDASDYTLGSVLSQICDSGKHPIEFDSRKLLPAELNYEIHDKKLLGIVWALKHWRAFLLSLSSSFEVLSNHSSLQYFMSSKILTHCQGGWAEFLSEFHFSITYRPGCLATLPDALSCWDDVYPGRGENFISKNPMNY